MIVRSFRGSHRGHERADLSPQISIFVDGNISNDGVFRVMNRLWHGACGKTDSGRIRGGKSVEYGADGPSFRFEGGLLYREARSAVVL